ncbi:MAG: NAD-binding protein [Bacteroidota bacterium]
MASASRPFLSWRAPRGIVAAAVASIFALRLAEAGHPGAELLVPLTFMVIVGTIAINGLTASPLARWLRVAQPNPQGALIVGAHSWARAIAGALQAEGYAVLLVDTNWANLSAARKSGLQTYYGSILSEYIVDEIKLDGIGRLLGMTSNDEVNSLGVLHFAEVFGRAEVYQLPSESKETIPKHLRGRLLFGPQVTYAYLTDRFAAGAVIKTTSLTQQFDYDALQEIYGGSAIPLFLITESGDLVVLTKDESLTPRPDQTLISLVNPNDQPPAKAPQTIDQSQTGPAGANDLEPETKSGRVKRGNFDD